MTETKKARKFPYLSLIRVISCLGIVILHTYYIYVSYCPAEPSQQVISYGIRNAMMWAVPCFVMVTGALLLDPARKLSLRKLFCRYILRAALALVIFTLLFGAVDLWLAGKNPALSDLWSLLLKMYTNGSWSHLWYLYMLIGLYLAMPAFRLITAGADRTTLRYLLLVGLIFMLILPTLDTITGVKTGFYIPVYTVYPFYLFLGYALHQRLIRIPRWLAGPMLAAGVLGALVLTQLQMTQGLDMIKKLLTNYSFVLTGLMAAGLFGLVLPGEKKAGVSKEPRWVQFLDENSFGVYLIHYLVLKLAVTQISWNPYQSGGNLVLLLVSLGVFLISLGVTFLLRLIPVVKKLL